MGLHYILYSLPDLPIKGLNNVTRALIHKKEVNLEKKHLSTLREGDHLTPSKLKYSEHPDVTKRDKNWKVISVDKEAGTVTINCGGDVDDDNEDALYEEITRPIEKFQQDQYTLYVEGQDCFHDVLSIPGINYRETTYNNVCEVREVLGIEAARQTIYDELS